MWAKELRRMVNPAILARRGIARIERVVNSVVLFVGLTHHQQTNLLLGVIEKSVADAGTSGKTHAVPRLQFPEIAVYPHFRIALQHIDELFLIALRVRVRGAPPGRQSLVVDPQPIEA